MSTWILCACTDPGPEGSGDGDAVWVDSEAGLLAGAPRLRIAVVDVGQGDGLVMELPSGQVMAVDGGPDRGAGYMQYLEGRRYDRIDAVLLSHAHADHYTGLLDAVARLPEDCAARVFDPGFDRMDASGYRSFRDAAGCRFKVLGASAALPLDPSVTISVLGGAMQPFPADDGGGINNTSLITQVRFGRFTMLLTGDAQTDAERRVVEQGAAALRSTVLKVGHHGSCNATGKSFLYAVAPKWALLSAAAGNDFGHPHCQTMSKLLGRGVHWMRTDVNGTITVVTDGTRYTIAASRGARDTLDCPRNCAMPTDF